MRRVQFLRGATSVVALILVGCKQQAQPTEAPTATGRAVGSATFALTGKLNNARWQHTATLLGDGKVLVVGGLEHLGGSVSSSAELYDPATGKWTATGNTGGARYGHTATLLKDGRVLAAGGGGGSGNSAELYDPATGKWTATGALTDARSGHTATLLGDGKVLVAGGGGGSLDSQGVPKTWASAELYDPATGSWSPTAKLNVARTQHCAVLLKSGKVLVAGGEVLRPMKASLPDPVTGRLAATGDLSASRAYHTATSLTNGRLLVAGGEVLELQDSPFLTSVELYDPATGTWAATGGMNAARNWYSMTLLADGRVLVAGGSGDGGSLSSAEMYDPTADKWTPAGNLSRKLRFHTATLLGNGSVLVAGGYPEPPPRDPETEASSNVELFDPTNGTWTEIGNLQIGRGFHTATLLNNGKVLVAGGSLGKIKDDDDRSAAAELGTYSTR